MGGEAWGGWWEWAWQKLHRAGGKVPSLPLGERAGLGRCCPGCWVQQPLDLELLLAIAAIDGGPVRLLADFGDFYL